MKRTSSLYTTLAIYINDKATYTYFRGTVEWSRLAIESFHFVCEELKKLEVL